MIGEIRDKDDKLFPIIVMKTPDWWLSYHLRKTPILSIFVMGDHLPIAMVGQETSHETTSSIRFPHGLCYSWSAQDLTRIPRKWINMDIAERTLQGNSPQTNILGHSRQSHQPVILV